MGFPPPVVVFLFFFSFCQKQKNTTFAHTKIWFHIKYTKTNTCVFALKIWDEFHCDNDMDLFDQAWASIYQVFIIPQAPIYQAPIKHIYLQSSHLPLIYQGSILQNTHWPSIH